MIIFQGNHRYAYRDPACYFKDGIFHLFFTLSEKDGNFMYNRIAHSKSKDLIHWSEPICITQKDHLLNYSSPGNMIFCNGKYILCVCSYPMPKPFAEYPYADETARIFTISTEDFLHFEEPVLLFPFADTPKEQMGRMIDPYILEEDDVYYLFFKQNGVSFSKSSDLISWEFLGHSSAGENACVIKREKDYLLIHSPENGIAFSTSEDLLSWKEDSITTLKQSDWSWAKDRITAGFAVELPSGFPHKYALFFHGSIPTIPETHGDATLAFVFTDDFKNFFYDIN